jgi:hypothetical protein
VIQYLKTKYWPESNPPQLYLLEESNIQTSLVVFTEKSNSQLQKVAMMTNDDLARTHITIPLRAVTAALMGISWPLSSFACVTLNTVRTDEMTMKIVASTK